MALRLSINGIQRGEEVLAMLRREARPVLLSFSGGKDAIALWLALREAEIEVIPFGLYLVPELEFVEESWRYFEEFFGVRIRRLPHPSLYRMLRNYVFQPPDRIDVITAMNLPAFDYDDLARLLKEDEGLPAETWMVTGVRCADSLNRRAMFVRNGPLNRKRRVAYPIWDWTKDAVVSAIRESGCKVPVDYQIFGRSIDGIDFRFLAPIAKHFPRDYARILEWFPLAELELKRQEFAHANKTRSADRAA